MRRIYLDHSATTPVDPQVMSVVSRCMLEDFGNPSSVHHYGRKARQALDNARDEIAAVLNCSSDEIYFTSGGTESDNISLLGYALQHRSSGNHIVISNIEHPGVANSADELERLGFLVTRIKADSHGQIDAEAVESVLIDSSILVSIMHVNNELGTINDIGSIGRMLQSKEIAFHTDAVQSFGKVPIDVQEMAVDMLSLSSHKFYGPQGVGALYLRNGIDVYPLTFGGHQEYGVRSGTENIPGIAGMGKAAAICLSEMESEARRLSDLRDKMYNRLNDELGEIQLNGHPVDRLPGILNLSFHGIEGEALLIMLDMEGIAASSGSACSSGSVEPSPILTAIGLSPEAAQSSIRFALGRSNTSDDVDYTTDVIIKSVNQLRSLTDADDDVTTD